MIIISSGINSTFEDIKIQYTTNNYAYLINYTLYYITAKVNGEPVFEKHFNKALKSDHVYAAHAIRGVFECEMICADHVECVAANMYYHGSQRYTCELIKQLPQPLKRQMLSQNKLGKFMRKIGNKRMKHSSRFIYMLGVGLNNLIWNSFLD